MLPLAGTQYSSSPVPVQGPPGRLKKKKRSAKKMALISGSLAQWRKEKKRKRKEKEKRKRKKLERKRKRKEEKKKRKERKCGRSPLNAVGQRRKLGRWARAA